MPGSVFIDEMFISLSTAGAITFFSLDIVLSIMKKFWKQADYCVPATDSATQPVSRRYHIICRKKKLEKKSNNEAAALAAVGSS
jgi:hypothetical protein